MVSPGWIVRQRIRAKYGLEFVYCTGTSNAPALPSLAPFRAVHRGREWTFNRANFLSSFHSTDCCVLLWCGCLTPCQHANEMRVREKGSVHS